MRILKYSIYLLFFVIIGSLTVFHFTQEGIDRKGYDFLLLNRIESTLKNKVLYIKPISDGLPIRISEDKTVIYVLGGNQDSLTCRFREASILYKKGLSRKILILSRPGITEYNADLGRNFTNNEWAIRELEKLNVRKEDVEPVMVQKSLFGTLSEAEDLSEFIRMKGFNKLILVTSAYHTRRTFYSFSRFASTIPIELYIYGSDDVSGLGGLFLEYIKLFLYDHLLFPICDWKTKKEPVGTFSPGIRMLCMMVHDEIR